jgi:hypothetical protein
MYLRYHILVHPLSSSGSGLTYRRTFFIHYSLMVDQSIPDPQPHLNEDLMRLIIDFIKDDDYIDLGACALTHSSLRSQSQRKLFHSINLFKQPQVEKIIYALSNNKTLGAYTRHLTVIDDENWVLDGSLLVKVLSYMSQLSSLSFEDIWESDFPKLTSETVVPPMSLNTLRFSNCRFESIHVLIRLLTIFYTAYHLELWFQTFQKSSISEQLPDTTPSPELKVTHLHVVGSRPQFKTSDVRVFLSYLEPGSLCFYHTEMTLGKQERSFFEPVCDVSAESLKYLHITTGPWITGGCHDTHQLPVTYI